MVFAKARVRQRGLSYAPRDLRPRFYAVKQRLRAAFFFPLPALPCLALPCTASEPCFVACESQVEAERRRGVAQSEPTRPSCASQSSCPRGDAGLSQRGLKRLGAPGRWVWVWAWVGSRALTLGSVRSASRRRLVCGGYCKAM